MILNSYKHIFVASLVILGCKGEQPIAAGKPSLPEAATAAPSPPITAKWVERSRSDTESRLTLEIAKLIPTEKPLTVRFSVPAGVTTEPLLTARELAPETTGTTSIEVVVRASTPPTQDLVAICDSQGVSFGFHAEVPYRFGRPGPTIVEPKLGEPIQIGPGQIRPVQLGK